LQGALKGRLHGKIHWAKYKRSNNIRNQELRLDGTATSENGDEMQKDLHEDCRAGVKKLVRARELAPSKVKEDTHSSLTKGDMRELTDFRIAAPLQKKKQTPWLLVRK
jgi:hypothetical protein